MNHLRTPLIIIQSILLLVSGAQAGDLTIGYYTQHFTFPVDPPLPSSETIWVYDFRGQRVTNAANPSFSLLNSGILGYGTFTVNLPDGAGKYSFSIPAPTGGGRWWSPLVTVTDSGGGQLTFTQGLPAPESFPYADPPPTPAWWRSRGVYQPGAGASDYSPLNVGQLKQLASAAYDEFNARISAGAGPALTYLLKTWYETVDGTVDTDFILEGDPPHRRARTTMKDGHPVRNYAAVNLGQLKTVAQLFYDRLIELFWARNYPWPAPTPTLPPPNDYAMATISEAKKLFSFDLSYDSEYNGVGDELPDLWERTNTATANDPDGTTDLDPDAETAGGGMTNLQAFADGLNPNVRAVFIAWADPDPANPSIQFAGTGTSADPYLCNTAEGFDLVMRLLYEEDYAAGSHGLQIRLRDATFETNGLETAGLGWKMGKNWALSGMGMYATTIKLKSWPVDTTGVPVASHIVVGATYRDTSGSSVRDLTVDANWGGHPWTPADLPRPAGRPTNVPWAGNLDSLNPDNPITKVISVALMGDNNVIERVRSINNYGMTRHDLESYWNTLADKPSIDAEDFILVVGDAPYDAQGALKANPEPGTNNRISDCLVEQMKGNYNFPVVLHAATNGRIERNVIKDNLTNSGCIGFIGKNIVVRNNHVERSTQPIYVDTSTYVIENVLVEGNEFLECAQGAFAFQTSYNMTWIRPPQPGGITGTDHDGTYGYIDATHPGIDGAYVDLYYENWKGPEDPTLSPPRSYIPIRIWMHDTHTPNPHAADAPPRPPHADRDPIAINFDSTNAGIPGYPGEYPFRNFNVLCYKIAKGIAAIRTLDGTTPLFDVAGADLDDQTPWEPENLPQQNFRGGNRVVVVDRHQLPLEEIPPVPPATTPTYRSIDDGIHKPVDIPSESETGRMENRGFFVQHGQRWRNWTIKNNIFEVSAAKTAEMYQKLFLQNGNQNFAIRLQGDWVTTENMVFQNNTLRMSDHLGGADRYSIQAAGVKGLRLENNIIDGKQPAPPGSPAGTPDVRDGFDSGYYLQNVVGPRAGVSRPNLPELSTSGNKLRDAAGNLTDYSFPPTGPWTQ